jgi:hypothetical protein
MSEPAGTVVIFGSDSIGYGAWGKGATRDEAKRTATRHGVALSKGYTVVTFGPEATFKGVNMMGACHWEGPAPAVEHVPARKAKR